MQRLPKREKWLARMLCSGYSLEELTVLSNRTMGELISIHTRLQEDMTWYLEI